VLQDPSYDLGRAPTSSRWLAAVSLVLWAGAITSGRFLAYTHNMMMASHQY